MIISFLDVLDRAHDGSLSTEKEWNVRVIPSSIAKVVKKHELQGSCDHENPINGDDSLADRFWEAGLDLAVDVGMFCTSTERVIRFSREEVLLGLEQAPGFWQWGVGRDAVDVKPRKPEDHQPPVVIAGPLGTPIYENLAIPIVQSHCQNWSADATSGLSLVTVYDRVVKTETPYETLGGALESRLLQEGMERAGRPGMPANYSSTCPSEYGAFGGVGGVPGGLSKAQAMLPCLFPAELKIDYHTFQKVAFCHIHHIGHKGGTWSMIGGYSGGIEGTAVAAVATAILQAVVLESEVSAAEILDMRYYGNCGRDAIWAISVQLQAVSRNSHLLTESDIQPVSGALTETILREATVSALMGAVSGAAIVYGIRTANGKYPVRTTGVESGYSGEVAKAAAGMTRAQANEIVKQLLPKYEDELKHPNIGVTFPECFDVKTVKPTKEWQDIYRKIKREVGQLGVPFHRWE